VHGRRLVEAARPKSLRPGVVRKHILGHLPAQIRSAPEARILRGVGIL
jgi:hypothetical protein